MRCGLGLGFGSTQGAAKAFPLTLTGLKAWYRSDLGITTVSGNVSAWTDQSGTGDSNKNLAQGTPGNRPIYNASDANFNGRPSLRCDTSRELASGTWAASLSNPFTVIMVARYGTGYGFIFDNLASQNNASIDNIGSSLVIIAQDGNNTSGISLTSGTTAAFACYFGSGADDAIEVNANSLTTVSGVSVGATLQGITVGGDRNNVTTHDNYVAEVVIVDHKISDTDLTALNSYFHGLYGVP